MTVTPGNATSVDRLKTLGGAMLFVAPPDATDVEIEQTYALAHNLEGSRLLIFRLRVPDGLPADRFILSESILQPDQYAAIDRFAFTTAAEWHRSLSTGPRLWSLLGGLDESELGWLVEYRFAERLLQWTKGAAVAAQAAGTIHASALILPAAWGPALADPLAKATSVATTVLPDGSRSEPLISRDEMAAVCKRPGEHLEQLVAVRYGGRRAMLHDSSFFRREFAGSVRPPVVADRLRTQLAAVRARFALAGQRLSLSPRRTGPALAERWRQIEADGCLRDRFTFEQIDLYPAVRPVLASLYTDLYPQLAAELRARVVLMKAAGVRCAVMNNDCLLSKKLEVLAARRLRIPSVTVQHGVFGEPNGEEHLFADTAAVWGADGQDWYAAYGNRPEQIETIGNPKYDALLRSLATRRVRDREAIVFAAQPAPLRSAYDTLDQERVYADAVIEAFGGFPAERFVVKLHPRQSDAILAYYERRTGAMPNVTVERDRPIGEMLAEAKLLITESSTVGFEAVLIGLPIITLNLTRRPVDPQPYGAGGVAVPVGSGAELREAMAELLRNPRAVDRLIAQHRPFTDRFLHTLDGRAAERLLALCVRLAGSDFRPDRR